MSIKKILIAILLCLSLASIMSIACSAEEYESESDEADTEENGGFISEALTNIKEAITGMGGTLSSLKSSLENMTDFFDGNWLGEGINDALNETISSFDGVLTGRLDDGGFSLVGKDTNKVIRAIYQITSPFGFAVLLIGWGFGVFKSGMSCAVDIKDRNSLIRSVLSLIIGLLALGISPALMTQIVGISGGLCSTIYNDINSLSLTSPAENGTVVILVSLIAGLVLGLNVLWLATLQAISPLFIGCLGGEGSKKFGMNFVKEYLKAALVPVVTIVYYKLVLTIVGNYATVGVPLLSIIIGLVFGISTLGVAGKKLDKLIN